MQVQILSKLVCFTSVLLIYQSILTIRISFTHFRLNSNLNFFRFQNYPFFIIERRKFNTLVYKPKPDKMIWHFCFRIEIKTAFKPFNIFHYRESLSRKIIISRALIKLFKLPVSFKHRLTQTSLFQKTRCKNFSLKGASRIFRISRQNSTRHVFRRGVNSIKNSC